MAERRMFTKSIIRSAHFMHLPIITQFLYLQMLLDADDDGFISNPDLEVTIAKCAPENLQTLIDKRYIMIFPSGIALIRHWFLHNYIRSDRYRETVYPEKKLVILTKERVYEWLDTEADTGKPASSRLEYHYPQEDKPEGPTQVKEDDEDQLLEWLTKDV